MKREQPLELRCGVVVTLASVATFDDYVVRRMKVNSVSKILSYIKCDIQYNMLILSNFIDAAFNSLRPYI